MEPTSSIFEAILVTDTAPLHDSLPPHLEEEPLVQNLRFHRLPHQVPGAPDATLRLVSYNILAESLALRHSQLYEHLTHKDLRWDARSGQLIAQLSATRADFFCLQEVDNFCQLRQSMAPLGYKGEFKKRTSPSNEDGCAILWNSSRYRLLRSFPIEFNRAHSSRMNFDNVALGGLFASLQDPNLIVCVVSTHFLFDPQRGDLKMGQAQYLLSIVEDVVEEARLQYAASEIPILIAGDMNSTPYSGIWELFRSGRISLDMKNLSGWRTEIGGQRIPRHPGQKQSHVEVKDSKETLKFLDVETNADSDVATFSHSLALCSAYQEYGLIHELLHQSKMICPTQPLFPSTWMGEPLVTSLTGGSKNAVDSIWFSHKSMHVHRLLELPHQNAVTRAPCRLPNELHPSDHFLLGADFTLSTPKEKFF